MSAAAPEILTQTIEIMGKANQDLADYLVKSAQASEAAIQAAVMAERERCAKIAEIEHMTPRDIARVIRSNWPRD